MLASIPIVETLLMIDMPARQSSHRLVQFDPFKADDTKSQHSKVNKDRTQLTIGQIHDQKNGAEDCRIDLFYTICQAIAVQRLCSIAPNDFWYDHMAF